MEEEKNEEVNKLASEQVNKLENKEEEKKEVNVDYKDTALRALADLENFKKRVSEENKAFKEFAIYDVIGEFIPVYNHFKKAMLHIPEDQKEVAWVKGIVMIGNQFKEVLKNYNIEGYDVIGKKFDHNTMEAIMTEKDETKEDEIVLKEIEPGYIMNGKIVKHAS